MLFIHGKKDTLIPYHHSYSLAKACLGKATVFIPKKMTHNKFDYFNDVICPIDNFLQEHKLYFQSSEVVQVPFEYFYVPDYV